MNEQEILEILKGILKRSLDDETIDLSDLSFDTNIFEKYGISSISAIYMALEIEKEFGVSIVNEDASSLRNVDSIIDLIKRKTA